MCKRFPRILSGLIVFSVVATGLTYTLRASAEPVLETGGALSAAPMPPAAPMAPVARTLEVQGAPVIPGLAEGTSGVVEIGGKYIAYDAGKHIRVKLVAAHGTLDAGTLQCTANVYDGNFVLSAADKRLPIIAVPGQPDTYEITLGEGVYRLDEIKVGARDTLGNTLLPVRITAGGDVETEDHITLGYLAVSKDVLHAEDLLVINPHEVAGQSGEAVVLKPKASGSSVVNLGVRDPLYPIYVAAGKAPVVSTSYTGIAGGTMVAPGLASMGWNAQAGAYEEALELTPENIPDLGISPDGVYTVTLSYRGQAVQKTVVVDNHAPLYYSATYGIEVPEGGNKLNIDDGEGDKLVATSGWVAFDIKDAFNGEKFVSEENASGVAHVTVTMPFSPEGADPDAGPTQEEHLEATYDASSTYWYVSFTRPGTYYFNQATFHAVDAAGNDGGTSMLTRLLSYDEHNKPISRLQILSPQAQPEVSVDVLDQEGAPAAPDGYHRGGVRLSVHISGILADLLKKSGLIDSLEVVYQVTDAQGETSEKVIPLSELSPDGPQRWTYELGTNEELPEEGTYAVRVRFPWVTGQITTAATTFVCDHTAPEFGPLMSSATGPVSWGSMFVSSDTTFTVSTADNVSGVAADTLGFSPKDSRGTLGEASIDGSGNITFMLSGDGSRLRLEGSLLTVSDKAGNEASVDLAELTARAGSNIPAGTKGAVVDTQAPVLSVSYDNNDARNGAYYQAARTATVTLEESNFDLTRENEPRKVIATASLDGRVSRQLLAQDFENPSGDGKTWVAVLPCTSDGDWTVDASYTDPAGHVSNAIVDSFVIDTMAPVITVTFDNNAAKNGLYFNAPRTATVSILERNFSPDLASVAAQAKEGIAPGPSSWVAADGSVWRCFVGFSSDGRYSITISCTDLAGNTAHETVVPEFVIDMTPPEVKIERVSDHTAYAGEIAPYASTSDTNYDLSASGITLEGVRRGSIQWMRGENRSYDRGGEVRDYVDFEHVLENDDVYTLTAKATDLAGNTAEKSVMFSVNRFGSTYYFSSDTASLRGEYLQDPHDIEVTEVNVSGLDTSASHVEVVKDSTVIDLHEGEDYSVLTSDERGWSATTYMLPAKLFSQDGYYRVMLTSHDRAGNLSQNTMENKNETRDADASVAFALDRTAPSARLAGVVSHGVYFGRDKETLPKISDNLEADRAVLSVDGKAVATWGPDQIASGDISYTLPADAKAHEISLSVWDKAGNKSTYTASQVVVASDLFAYIAASPVRLFGVICTGIVGLGVLGTLVYVSTRRWKLTADERDPFGSAATK